MKRIQVILLSVILCLAFSLAAFAENVYIVDDGEDDFVAANPTTTTQAPETTTAPGLLDGLEGILGEGTGGLSDKISDSLGSGIDALLSGIGSLLPGQNTGSEQTQGTTASSGSPQTINPGVTNRYSSSVTTTAAEESTTGESQNQSTATTAQSPEPVTVIVMGGSEDNSSLSGSTLTLIIFIAAVVLLILVIAAALVFMTRRTEFNSAVRTKSTIPSVEQPKTLIDLMNDDIIDDGNDYSDIMYWDGGEQ